MSGTNVGDTNAELARRGYEAALRGDLGAIAKLLSPNVRWHGGDPAAPAACHDREEALAFMRRAGSLGNIGELVDVVEAGEKVVVIMRPAGGTGLTANVSTFREGRVVEMVHYPDAETALLAADA